MMKFSKSSFSYSNFFGLKQIKLLPIDPVAFFFFLADITRHTHTYINIIVFVKNFANSLNKKILL
jgi:hypothetical protein